MVNESHFLHLGLIFSAFMKSWHIVCCCLQKENLLRERLISPEYWALMLQGPTESHHLVAVTFKTARNYDIINPKLNMTPFYVWNSIQRIIPMQISPDL